MGLGQTVSLEVPTLPTDNLRSWVIATSHLEAYPTHQHNHKNNMRERITADQVRGQPHLSWATVVRLPNRGYTQSIYRTSLEHLLEGARVECAAKSQKSSPV